MIGNRSRHLVTVGALLALLLLMSLSPAARADHSSGSSLSREHDPVLLTGEQMPTWNGVSLDQLFLYVYRQGSGWEQIPWQFDEKTDGVYVSSEDGLLDSDDELVFMAADCGEQATAAQWIGDIDARSHRRYEIVVTDPLHAGDKCRVYLYRSATLSKTTTRDYVDYNGYTATTDAYHLTMKQKNLIAENLALGENKTDVLDRTKVRLNADGHVLTEEVLASGHPQNDWYLIRDGDVRTITHFLAYGNNGPRSLLLLTLTNYRSMFHEHITLDLSWLAPGFDENRYSVDPGPAIVGATYYDANTPSGVLVDGHPDDVPASPFSPWIQFSHPTLATVLQIIDPTPLGGTSQTYYKDDDSYDEADTGDHKSYGEAGMLVLNGSANLNFNVWYYILPAGQPNVGASYAAASAQPLQAQTDIQQYAPAPTTTPTTYSTNTPTHTPSPTPTATPLTLYLPLLTHPSGTALQAMAAISYSTEPEHWVSGFGPPGVQGWVSELIEDEAGVLYAAGNFDVFGRLEAHNIARWDGHAWSTLGTGLDGSVYALALDQDGNLYVAGAFTHAGGAPANHIARWDGSQWAALSSGLNYEANSLAITEAGHVYVGGEFTRAGGKWVNHVAKWDGETWSTVGGGVPGNVWALAFDHQGNLYAARHPGIVVNHNYGDVRKWDGETWATLSGAVNMFINELAVDTAGNLYAGGHFTTMGGVAMPYIARWDGEHWTSPGGGMDGTVYQLRADAQGTIYAAGNFHSAGGTPVAYLASWDGSQWQAVGNIIEVEVYALSVTPNAHVSISRNSVIYQLENNAWQSRPIPAGNGMSDWVLALSKDGRGQFYTGGRFLRASDHQVLRVAHWDGARWQALGEGLNEEVDALATDDQGILYAGGDFTATGQLSLPYIARWDGQTWSTLGGGMDARVSALVADHAGNLYAGGYFEKAGGVTANRVAKWDGQQWLALGNGFNHPVWALVTGPDGALYAGGGFDNVVTVDGHTEHLNGVARWDGQQWRGLDDGLAEPSWVDALAIDGAGNLYAGGAFTRISHGYVPVNQVARWDGQQWQTLGSGVTFVSNSYFTAEVSALAVDSQGVLYAGGLFNRAGGQPANYVARWDGSAWSALGAGVDGPATEWFNWVYALLLDDGQLFVGGHFDTAGEFSSRNIALWSWQTPTPTPTLTPTSTLTSTPSPTCTLTFTPTPTATLQPLYMPLIIETS